MKRCWQTSQLIMVLAVAWASLAWETGCSRQLAAPVAAGSASNAQLPFDRVSDSSGISPTAGFHVDGVPAGTAVTVRLQSALSSADTRAGDSFQAVLAEPMVVAGRTVVPLGTAITGSVVAGKASGGLNNPGYLRLTLASIVLSGKPIPLQTSTIFAKGGWYKKRKPPAIVRSEAGGKGTTSASTVDSDVAPEPLIDAGQSDVKFSTGHRLTFRLVQPLHP
jgi:hypothetical protein